MLPVRLMDRIRIQGGVELSLSVIVLPFCVVLAYKRIPLKHLGWNGALWFLPFTFSNYMDFRDNAEGFRLFVSLALMGAVYIIALLVGVMLEQWLKGRQH